MWPRRREARRGLWNCRGVGRRMARARRPGCMPRARTPGRTAMTSACGRAYHRCSTRRTKARRACATDHAKRDAIPYNRGRCNCARGGGSVVIPGWAWSASRCARSRRCASRRRSRASSTTSTTRAIRRSSTRHARCDTPAPAAPAKRPRPTAPPRPQRPRQHRGRATAARRHACNGTPQPRPASAERREPPPADDSDIAPPRHPTRACARAEHVARSERRPARGRRRLGRGRHAAPAARHRFLLDQRLHAGRRPRRLHRRHARAERDASRTSSRLYGSLANHANWNDHETPTLLQVIGDTMLGAKAFHQVTPWLTLGGDLRFVVLNAIGDIGPVVRRAQRRHPRQRQLRSARARRIRRR